MGLWSKGLERAQTGEWRKEDGTIFNFIEDTCHLLSNSWGNTVHWEHQVTPVGHFCFIKMDECCMSFLIDQRMSKEHVLSEMIQGFSQLEKMTYDKELKDKLMTLQITLSWKMMKL